MEPRRIRLKSNSYTVNNMLDTVTAASIQVKRSHTLKNLISSFCMFVFDKCLAWVTTYNFKPHSLWNVLSYTSCCLLYLTYY